MLMILKMVLDFDGFEDDAEISMILKTMLDFVDFEDSAGF